MGMAIMMIMTTTITNKTVTMKMTMYMFVVVENMGWPYNCLTDFCSNLCHEEVYHVCILIEFVPPCALKLLYKHKLT